MNVPLVRYSREEVAVVNGGTGTCDSSLAPTARVQPSGVFTVAGAPDGTCPAAGGAESGAADSEDGSAPAEDARAPAVTRQAAKTETWRITTDDGFTANTVNRACLTSGSSLVREI